MVGLGSFSSVLVTSLLLISLIVGFPPLIGSIPHLMSPFIFIFLPTSKLHSAASSVACLPVIFLGVISVDIRWLAYRLVPGIAFRVFFPDVYSRLLGPVGFLAVVFGG